MYIQVLFDEISYEPVCDYYNNHKPEEWNPLCRLERAEGGFCIDFKNNHVDDKCIFSSDPNSKIKQVRWSRKCLKTPNGFYSLNNDEIRLLYESICKMYGDEQVILHY